MAHDQEGDGRDPLQESALTGIAAGIGAAGGLASLGSLYDTRAQYLLLARNDHDAERAFRAKMVADADVLDIECRALHAQLLGLEPLDDFNGFGVDDEPFEGFEVE